MSDDKNPPERLFGKFLFFIVLTVAAIFALLSILGVFDTGPLASHPKNTNPKIGWVDRGDFEEKCDGTTMILQNYSVGHSMATIPNDLRCK